MDLIEIEKMIAEATVKLEAENARLNNEVAKLREENEALAKNLRGKHATTGATYEHLIQERDALREQVKQQAAVIEQMWKTTLAYHSPDHPLYKQALALQHRPEELIKRYTGMVEDAKRYRWMREYLPSDDERWDDALVAARTPEQLDAVIDDAIAKENGK